MERNTVTTIDKLEIGDRFYKVGDKKKDVYTKVGITTMQKDGERYPMFLNPARQIVFIRHKTEA